MSTYLEQYLDEIEALILQLATFSSNDFDPQELKQLISTAGLRTEHFLRAAVVPNTSPKDDFGHVINALQSIGVSKEQRGELHKLRELYNNIKHDPTIRPSVSDALERVRQAQTFASSLQGKSIGKVNDEVSRVFHRILWVAGWDHYIGGDTEVHVLFPSSDPNPPSIDSIHVAMHAWQNIKEDLDTLGKVTAGPDAIPRRLYAACRAEGDFLDAFSFEGEYRDLLSTLAKYELRVEGLIEPMHRENTIQSMIQAFALASIDVADFATDTEDLAAAIYVQAINLYAVSPAWPELHRWCEEFADLVGAISSDQRAGLSGPVWLQGDAVSEEGTTALAIHKWLPVFINSRRTMCLKR